MGQLHFFCEKMMMLLSGLLDCLSLSLLPPFPCKEKKRSKESGSRAIKSQLSVVKPRYESNQHHVRDITLGPVIGVCTHLLGLQRPAIVLACNA